MQKITESHRDTELTTKEILFKKHTPKEFFFEECDKKNLHISLVIYMTLFIIGVVGIATYYVSQYKAHDHNYELLPIVAFAIATGILQFTLYVDLHAIESFPDKAKEEYENWINCRLERILRFLIMIALLYGVGEIALQHGNQQQPHEIFTTASALSYFLLIVWNIFAYIKKRTVLRKCEDSICSTNDNQKQQEILQALVKGEYSHRRILFYIFVSCLGFFYWSLVYTGVLEDYVEKVALALIIIYCGLVMYIVTMSLPSRKEKWLVKNIRKYNLRVIKNES